MNFLMRYFFVAGARRSERGFTLLEYCAGAVVLLTIVYVAMRGMGENLGGFMTAIGDWASSQGEQIRTLP